MTEHVIKPPFWFRRWVILTSAGLITIGLGTGAAFFSDALAKQPTILPRVSVGGVDMGRLTPEQAKQKLGERAATFLKEPFSFESGDKKFSATPEELGLAIDVDGSVEEAFNVGHRDQFVASLAGQVLTAFGQERRPINASFDQDTLTGYLDSAFLKIEKPAVDARLAYQKRKLNVLESHPGSEVVQAPVLSALKDQSDFLSHSAIPLTLTETQPAVLVDDLDEAKVLANKAINSKLTLAYRDREYIPSKEDIGNWLEFHSVAPAELTKADDGVLQLLVTTVDQERRGQKAGLPYYVLLLPENFNNLASHNVVASVGLNRDKLNHWITEHASSELDVPGENARFSFDKGVLKVTKPSKNGVGVDVDQAAHDVVFSIASEKPRVRLALKTAKPGITEDRIQELGITTLIGKGQSSFAGSPGNRIVNIRVGLEKFDGLVIAPGDEFSTVKPLSPIDGTNGFLPELVISGNKIKPEFGGGLCQVSTTMFRAALDSGLDITERLNHAFAVSYYRWPYYQLGVEATIYDPEPDLKFKNDTGHYILIHTYITDDQRAVVEFYGTDIGRDVTIDGPYRVSGNDVSGGSTVFNYIIKDHATGKEIHRESFTSVFQPLSKFKHTN